MCAFNKSMPSVSVKGVNMTGLNWYMYGGNNDDELRRKVPVNKLNTGMLKLAASIVNSMRDDILINFAFLSSFAI